jgi:hypothetical protein
MRIVEILLMNLLAFTAVSHEQLGKTGRFELKYIAEKRGYINRFI